MKEFAGIVLIVGYHFKIVVRSVIERFPAILPSMEEVKKKYCVSIYTKGHWFFLSVSLIAEEYAS